MITVNRYLRPELPIARINPKKPGLTINVRTPLVVMVLDIGDFSNIRDPVIRSRAVDMIDLVNRKYSVNVKPGEAVSQVKSAINLYADIAARF